MNKIIVRGTQNFMGMEIPIIAGGFGEGCKAMLAKTIAEIHNQPLKKINQLINENLDEFEFGIDILDLRLVLTEYQSLENILLSSGYTKRGLTATLNQNGNIYLLSEQGYMLLVGFMRTEKSKQIRKQLRREYFAMREVINSQEQLKNKLLLDLFSNDPEVVANAHKGLVELETKPLLEKIDSIEPLADKYNIYLDTDGLTDIATFSKDLGIKKLGRNNMYKWLKDNKYLMKDNMPYQRYVDQGIFLVKPTGTFINHDGEIEQAHKTYITKKGVDYIINKLKECKLVG